MLSFEYTQDDIAPRNAVVKINGQQVLIQGCTITLNADASDHFATIKIEGQIHDAWVLLKDLPSSALNLGDGMMYIPVTPEEFAVRYKLTEEKASEFTEQKSI